MAASVVLVHEKNRILYNTKETQIQSQAEGNLPCTGENLEQLSSLGIQKSKFISCKIDSYTTNSEIRSVDVTTTTSKFYIIFEFTCTPIDVALIQRVDSTLVKDTTKHGIVKKLMNFKWIRRPIRNFDPHEFKKATYKTMAKELEHWPLGADGRQELIEFAWKKVSDVAELVPTNHNMLYLCFHTILTHHHSYDEIKTLPGTCSICLKEYSEDIKTLSGRCPICWEEYSQMKCLPCSHVLHRHCINKWFQKCISENRHYPLCRICLQEYYDSQIKYLPCSHVFHHYCINKWQEICCNENRCCPQCFCQLEVSGIQTLHRGTIIGLISALLLLLIIYLM